MGKLLAERGTFSACFHEIVAALRKNIKGCEVEKDKAADMLTMVTRLHEHAPSRLENLRAVYISELREMIDKLTDEVELKHLEHLIMVGLIAETFMLQE